MQKVIINLPEIKLVGIKCRTNNTAEQDPSSARIGTTLQKYFQTGVSEKIANRSNPCTTYCAYTEYESDFSGDYSYFVGEEVTEVSDISEDMVELIIPAQKYVKFTNNPGAMPQVCINMWQNIWKMTPGQLGGARSYLVDFEIYDSRAADPNNTVLDLCIGIS